MSKKWYKVTFYARMDDEDLHSMNKYFHDSMEEYMEISPCEGLEIEEDEPSNALNYVSLEEDDYELDEKTGELKIDKQVFDDFEKDCYIDINFLKENDEDELHTYIMRSEDNDYIYCEFLD